MKLIDKDVLVAELKHLENIYKECSTRSSYGEGLKDGRLIGYKDALHKIDTLEVKKVDFEKEIDKFYGMYRKDGKTFDIEDNEECVDWKVDCNPDFEIAFAKHFFELGLKVQKGE